MDLLLAKTINRAMVSIWHIREGVIKPVRFAEFIRQVQGFTLVELLQATLLVDKDNDAKRRQAQLVGSVPEFEPTCTDRIVAAIYVFANSQLGEVLVWDGTWGLGLVRTAPEEDTATKKETTQ